MLLMDKVELHSYQTGDLIGQANGRILHAPALVKPGRGSIPIRSVLSKGNDLAENINPKVSQHIEVNK